MFENIKHKEERILFMKLFILSIIIHWFILIISYILLLTTGEGGGGFFSFFHNHFMNASDSPHYLNIAKNGYAKAGENAKFIVFYPLYPLLIRIVQTIVRNYFAAGILISNVCMGIGGYYCYKLSEMELGKEKAFDTLLALLLYPFGIFMVGVWVCSLRFFSILPK